MELKSKAFSHEGSIPQKYTCQGIEVSPPLELRDAPEGCICFALIMDDPDVPRSLRADGMYDHWIVFNIDPKTTEIKEGSPPFGILGRNTSGKIGYIGPCPPDREHRYFFRLYALDTFLNLKEGASKNQVLDAMKGHILASATLMGRYEKS